MTTPALPPRTTASADAAPRRAQLRLPLRRASGARLPEAWWPSDARTDDGSTADARGADAHPERLAAADRAQLSLFAR